MTAPLSGERPIEFWQLTIREIVERALDKNNKEMCNVLKTYSPELVEMSRSQHKETLEKIDELLGALASTLRVLYISVSIMVGFGILILGVMLFTIFFVTR